MRYRGPFNSAIQYEVGDVVLHTDGYVYHLQKPAPTGTEPIDTRYWGQVSQLAAEILIMLTDLFTEIYEQLATIPHNIDDSSLVLKSGDNEYLVSVDDTGDTPELAVELIEEEEDGGGEG